MSIPFNTEKKVVNIVTCSFSQHGRKLTICPQEAEQSLILSDYTDSNFPLRCNALHPRLKGKIPKMMQYKYQNADFYIWVDSKFTITSPHFVSWLISSLNNKEIAFFEHPNRSSISEELEFMSSLMSSNNSYLIERYCSEPMTEQVNTYIADSSFIDNTLISAGMFIYTHEFITKHPTFMSDWLLENVLWSVQDQLSLPYMLYKHNVDFSIISENILSNQYAIHTG
jgi:hypothetical protein